MGSNATLFDTNVNTQNLAQLALAAGVSPDAFRTSMLGAMDDIGDERPSPAADMVGVSYSAGPPPTVTFNVSKATITLTISVSDGCYAFGCEFRVGGKLITGGTYTLQPQSFVNGVATFTTGTDVWIISGQTTFTIDDSVPNKMTISAKGDVYFFGHWKHCGIDKSITIPRPV